MNLMRGVYLGGSTHSCVWTKRQLCNGVVDIRDTVSVHIQTWSEQRRESVVGIRVHERRVGVRCAESKGGEGVV